MSKNPLNVAIVGGGKVCYFLLKILDKDRLSRINMKILGVASSNENSPGLVYARDLNLFTTNDFKELYKLEGLNLILELTGREEVRKEILRTKPSGVALIDHRSAGILRILWDLFLVESEKVAFERERRLYEEQKKKYTQTILDSLPYRVMVVNRDNTIEAVNQTFLREYGFRSEEVVGRYCYEVRYGLDKPCSEDGRICYLEKVKKEKEVISTIHEYRDENGEQRFDVITVSPILNDHGETVQLVEASRDVTDRIKLEHEVRKSNTFLQNVIQSTVDGIVVVDTKGKVLIFNEGMERLTGYSAQEIINKGHLSSFYDIEMARENMKKMRSSQYGPPDKLNPTSMFITTKDGEKIPVTLSASIIRVDGKEMGSVGVFTDMREILKMRRELEEAQLQLIQSDKIASIGRMAAGVAHEINNPLSGILIYAELLKENLKDDPQSLDDLEEMIQQTLRCKRIVSDLLEFSRKSIGKVSFFSLERLIEQCLNLLINQASFQNIEVKKDIQSNMPEMIGDIGQLQQVFTNLFINAADAMEGRGRLDIKARYEAEQQRFIISVADSGPGIPEEFRDKIFDMFFTTKPTGKGTGLGLSITQNIIKLHGGRIDFECPPEGGTNFIIELPRKLREQPIEEDVFIGLDES